MKIIFSRKGVDSQAGKLFSAIIDERLVSIPIPVRKGDRSKTRYRDLTVADVPLAALVEHLSARKAKRDRRCADEFVHFDPDLRHGSLKRMPGWQPLLGLGRNHPARLAEKGVGKGAIFLFFGPFRRVYKDSTGRYRYAPGSKQHVIHGWLQIGHMLKAGPARRKTVPEWMRYPSHFLNDFGEQNTVYVASRRLTLPGFEALVPGGGSFDGWCPKLCLTAPGGLMSQWCLPFKVDTTLRTISPCLVSKMKVGRQAAEAMCFSTRLSDDWQDEVLDTLNCPGAIDWLLRLFDRGSSR